MFDLPFKGAAKKKNQSGLVLYSESHLATYLLVSGTSMSTVILAVHIAQLIIAWGDTTFFKIHKTQPPTNSSGSCAHCSHSFYFADQIKCNQHK